MGWKNHIVHGNGSNKHEISNLSLPLSLPIHPHHHPIGSKMSNGDSYWQQLMDIALIAVLWVDAYWIVYVGLIASQKPGGLHAGLKE